MARPPKPKNLKTPLRLLRSLLSKQGEDSPMSQLAFSQLIEVPVSTIKAIENDERPLSDRVLNQVADNTGGAHWNNQSQQWTDQGAKDRPPQPFTFEMFSEFLRQRSTRPANWVMHGDFLAAKMALLFVCVPESKWWKLRSRIGKCLEDCRIELGIYPPTDAEGKKVSSSSKGSRRGKAP